MNVLDRIRSWTINRGIASQRPDRNGFCANITEELGEFLEASKKNDENETIDAIADIIIFSTTELVKRGYDIEKVIDEVLLVVESRVGEWNEVNNKFEKDTSPEAKANWHTANYKRCKVR